CFLFAAGKPAMAQCRLQYAEAATDDANAIFGFMDAVGADSLIDNGGGPKAEFDGAVFYKIDGGTRWRVRSSNATAHVDHQIENVAGGAAFVTLRIEVIPRADGYAEVSYWIDPAGG